jgi:DNA-binding transcriptional regulator YiaG
VLKEGIIVPQQHDALRKYKLQQINQHDAADYPDTANMRTQTQHKLLTIQEAAQTLNLSVWTLRSWADQLPQAGKTTDGFPGGTGQDFGRD